jgi:hypothetical protein
MPCRVGVLHGRCHAGFLVLASAAAPVMSISFAASMSFSSATRARLASRYKIRDVLDSTLMLLSCMLRGLNRRRDCHRCRSFHFDARTGFFRGSSSSLTSVWFESHVQQND